MFLVFDMQHNTICTKLKSLQSFQLLQFLFTPSAFFVQFVIKVIKKPTQTPMKFDDLTSARVLDCHTPVVLPPE